jgi:hypothetical protein
MEEEKQIAPEPIEEEVVHPTCDNCQCEEGDPPCQPRKKRKYVRKDPNKKITRKRSPEHNEKIAAALRGRTLDPAHRDAIAQSMIGNSNRNGAK